MSRNLSAVTSSGLLWSPQVSSELPAFKRLEMSSQNTPEKSVVRSRLVQGELSRSEQRKQKLLDKLTKVGFVVFSPYSEHIHAFFQGGTELTYIIHVFLSLSLCLTHARTHAR